ncbi:MAG: type ISP restriction/modification enzyme [Candidatus Hodarchaeota archaeon]
MALPGTRSDGGAPARGAKLVEAAARIKKRLEASLDDGHAPGILDTPMLLKKIDLFSIVDELRDEKNVFSSVNTIYEDLLHQHDKEEKFHRGAFYTPDPVVSFMVRSVDALLKRNLDIKGGLTGDDKNPISMLDPATGTGAFLLEVTNQTKGNLPRLLGYEVMLEPWIIAHLNLFLKLAESGRDIKKEKSFSLKMGNVFDGIKDEPLVNVIIGNPPYRGHSANKVEWIEDLMRGKHAEDPAKRSYFEVDGEPLGEKNPKWVNDDYVKFIRLGQWLVDKAGWGVVAFITNHNYLDTATFRGMRESLLNGFSKIYVLDLHGNARRQETCPDGSKDENVFDSIQQGVCISFFIKKPAGASPGATRVFRKDAWGLRDAKFDFLDENDVSTIEWEHIKPFPPWYMFHQLSRERWEEYERGWPINEIFPTSSICIITARDKFTIKRTREEVRDTIRAFVALDPEAAREKYALGDDARDWKVAMAMDDLKSSGLKEENIQKILYRPFDYRYTYYTGRSRGFHCMPRGETMDSMKMEGNIGLLTRRQMLPNRPCNYFFVVDCLVSDGVIRSDNKGGESIYPLYLYDDEGSRKSNIDPRLLEELAERYGINVMPGEILHYAYALFHNTKYREKYAAFLRLDYPRVIFAGTLKEFERMVRLGKQLVELHLGRIYIETSIAFKGDGSNAVEGAKFDQGKVFINEKQYFEPVDIGTWEFYIGTYKVLEKWLKSRKGETLQEKDVQDFKQTCEIIGETMLLMKEING